MRNIVKSNANLELFESHIINFGSVINKIKHFEMPNTYCKHFFLFKLKMC